MELDSNTYKYNVLSHEDIKCPFQINRHRIRNTPPPSQGRDVGADSESSPLSSPVSTRQAKRLSLFDSPHTPRSLVRRLSQSGKDSPRRLR